jgi:DNA-binding beta-propeller fold protein YncE
LAAGLELRPSSDAGNGASKGKRSMQRAWPQWMKGALAALAIILFLADAIYLLWAIWSSYFVSVPPFQYATLVWGIFSGIVAMVPIAAAGHRIIRAIVTGHEQRPRRISIDHLIFVFVQGLGTALRRPWVSLPTIVVLAATAPVIYFFARVDTSPRTSSSVVVVTKGDDKFIYVADSDNGQVLVYESRALAKPSAIIPIGTHGNQPGRGRPENMIELHRSEKVHLIFVTDTVSDKVHIIDLRYNTVSDSALAVGTAPRSLAVTPDQKKLFVSNEQPAPNGPIGVFDIGSDNPQEFRLTSTIKKVNCPEGLSISPDGRRLYVATQCSGGEDPILVIDTATNDTLYAIRKLAVGTSVTVSRDGRQIYVGRGNFPCARPNLSEAGSPFSVVSLGDNKISNFCLRTSVGPIALSRDRNQRFLFVGNGNRLTVFDTQKFADRKTLDATLTDADPYLTDIPLEAAITGIGIADDSVFAYLPQSRRLFLYSPPMLSP